MRVSREKFMETRTRILDTAARLFREKGFDGIGLADIMKAAGLTHGGFYKHFDSKEELEACATSVVMEKSTENWRRIAERGEPRQLENFIKTYLTSHHRDNGGSGCVLAALGADVARQSARVRSAFAAGLDDMLDEIAMTAPGDTPEARRESAIAIFAELVGGLILARAVGDPDFSNEILAATSSHLSGIGQSGRDTDA